MFKSIRNVTIVLLLVKVIGFIKQSVIAAYFGATSSTDTYMLVSELVDSLGEVLFSSVSVTFLTMYTNIIANGTNKDKKQFTSNVVFFGTPIVIILAVIVFVFSDFWSTLLAPGYNASELNTVSKYLKILSAGIVAMFLSALCRAILDAEKHFIPSKLEGLIKSIVTIILCITCGKTFGVDVLIWSILAYYILADIYLIINVYRKTGIRLLKPSKRDSRLKKLIVYSIPLFISNGSVYLHNIVDKAIGSTLESGSISILSYSNYITNTIHSLIIGSICTVLLSYFSTYVAENRIKELSIKLEECIRLLIIVIGLILVGIITSAQEIVTLLYGRGAFGNEAIRMTSNVFIIYGVGLIFIGIRDVLIRTHYAFQKNKTAMINGIIGMFINIVLSIFLSQIWGVYGIAIATVISYVIIMLLSLYTIRNDIEITHVKDMIKLIVQIAIIIIMIIAANYPISLFIDNYHYMVQLIIRGIMICVLYILMLYLLKNDEICKGIDIAKASLKKNVGR